ncbi:MAG: DUF4340 domain-containing protein [Pirellulaceae bacterium]|nr:DUF4340 domain-containing protein [Pirellulaceae bacterium]
MKSNLTTLLMALIATASVLAALAYYPRLEVQDVLVREKLLTDEQAFEPRDVQKVRIESFDSDTNSPSQFEVALDRGSWVIREHENYTASNNSRVSEAVSSIRDKQVLEVVSSNKNDHEEYGVLDMSEMGNSGLGVGTVLTFEGRNEKRLAKLIVGTSPEGEPDQRYVRLAGQPQIYVVEFDPAALTTKFSDWVDGELIKVGGSDTPLPNLVKHIDVDLYYRDQGSDKKYNYRALIEMNAKNQWVYSLWQPDDSKKLADDPAVVKQLVNQGTLARLVQQVMKFEIMDVERKQETVALDLANPDESQPASHFDSLVKRGFFHAGFQDGQHQFDAAAGTVTIALRFGMQVEIHVGNIAGMGGAGGGSINRAIMLNAQFNGDLVPMPKESSDASVAKEGEADGEQQDELSAEQYQQALQQRQQVLDFAKKETRAFNQLHADWIYEVSDEAISSLLPPAAAWVNQDP